MLLKICVLAMMMGSQIPLAFEVPFPHSVLIHSFAHSLIHSTMHTSSDLKSKRIPAGKKGSFERIKCFLVLGWRDFGFAQREGENIEPSWLLGQLHSQGSFSDPSSEDQKGDPPCRPGASPTSLVGGPGVWVHTHTHVSLRGL